MQEEPETRLTKVLVVVCLSLLLWVFVAALWSPTASAASRYAKDPSETSSQELASHLDERPDSLEPYADVYEIQPGDTLSELAIRLNTSVDSLVRSNRIADPNLIYAGDELHYRLEVVPDAASEEEGEEGEEEKRPDEPDEAAKLRYEQNSNERGKIPEDALLQAAAQADRMKVEPLPGASSSSTGDVGAQAAGIDRNAWTWRGPGNVGGRVRSLAINPTSPQTMWAGSVGGGIWKTTDGGASWRALDDFMANLAVSTLVVDPNNPNVLYAGTGEGVYNGDALRGAGVFKTTDGGATWTRLQSTATPDFHYVNRLAISPANSQELLAATRTGIWRSADGGSTWTQRLGFTDDVGIFQVAFDPNSGSRAVASGAYGRAFYSLDGGASWSTASRPWDTNSFNTRVELSYAPSSSNIVYASVNQSSGQIYKSTNGGQSYALISSPAHLSGQGWYDNAIWVSPTNPNFLISGGVDLFRSTDGGATLTQISDWRCGGLNSGSCGGSQSAHADQHTIIPSPGYNGTTNKTVFFGNDGGVYKAQDVSTVSQYSGWQELNNNFGVTQFYGGAGNTSSGRIVGGAQDNGDLNYVGDPEAWRQMSGGDGGFSAADPTNTNYFYGEYVRLEIHRSTNGGASSSPIYQGIADAGRNTSNALFIAPFILDPNDPNTMLAGGRSLWRSTNVKAATPGWNSIKGPFTNNIRISAIAVAPGNSNIVWVGYENGLIYKTTNGTAASPTWTREDLTTMPDRYATRITVDPRNSSIVYATFGGFSQDNVWRTTDGGSTWTDITGSGTTGLPDAPVRSLVVHPNNSQWLYVGTEVGVFASDDGGATWSLPTDGPANVSVDELFWMGTRLVAATHGRGMFEAETVSGTQAPANDNFANAQELTGANATANGTNNGATKENGEPNHAGNVGGKSVWYKWTPQAGGNATIDTSGSNFNTLLAVYTGSAVNSLSPVASNDDENNAGGLLTSKVVFTATAGTTYRIAVDGYSGASGSVTLHLASSSGGGDTTPPDVSLTAPADGAVVRGTAVTLSANATDNVGVGRVEFFAGGNRVGTDTSAPYSLTWDSSSVADGRTSVTARAFDAAGNQATSVRDVIVDNQYPNTRIISGPPGRTRSTRATFRFSSPDGDVIGFRCSLDGRAYRPCGSPKTYRNLSVGKHMFRVKAVGSAGAVIDSDPTPATWSWTVKRRR